MFHTFALLALLTLSDASRTVDCDGTIVVLVQGFRGTAGQGAAALFATADGFPIDADRAVQKATATIEGGAATVSFTHVAAGDYGVSAIHDANSNGRLDRNWIGKPTEGYGVSNDAKPKRFRPPVFADARFHVSCGVNNIVINLSY